jgi:hypothetical protein
MQRSPLGLTTLAEDRSSRQTAHVIYIARVSGKFRHDLPLPTKLGSQIWITIEPQTERRTQMRLANTMVSTLRPSACYMDWLGCSAVTPTRALEALHLREARDVKFLGGR